MPYGDGTGPSGWGPMTGRAAGYCAGYGAPGYMNPSGGRGAGRGFGRGFGMGFRGGRGRRWAAPFGYAAPLTHPPVPAVDPGGSRQELDALRAQAEYLKNALDTIQARLDELEQPGSKTDT